MRVETTELAGVLLIEPRVYRDTRGEFFESYREDEYERITKTAFVQDNISLSHARVLRGLHLQTSRPQAKLVSVLEGEVFDVTVDVRVGSPSFGMSAVCNLSRENGRQLFIPVGFAHGFVVLSEHAVFSYKCSDYYHAPSEVTIRWDDPELAIPWPVRDVILSPKDAGAPSFAEVRELLPRYETP